MLLSVCQKCGLELPPEQVLHVLKVESQGIVEHKQVCQRCYNNSLNENTNKANLLVEG